VNGYRTSVKAGTVDVAKLRTDVVGRRKSFARRDQSTNRLRNETNESITIQ
jgi:hypothetical protein